MTIVWHWWTCTTTEVSSLIFIFLHQRVSDGAGSADMGGENPLQPEADFCGTKISSAPSGGRTWKANAAGLWWSRTHFAWLTMRERLTCSAWRGWSVFLNAVSSLLAMKNELNFLWGGKIVKGVASQRDEDTKRNYQTTSKSRLVMECAPQKDNMPRKMRKLSVLRLG